MTRIGIVGCGNSKYDEDEWGRAHPEAEAGDEVEQIELQYLYKSSYSTVKRRYGHAVCADFRILSAEHHLADPTMLISESYDKSIMEMDDEEIEAWAETVRPQLREFANEHPGAVIDILLGQPYIDPIQECLDNLPNPVEYVFDGTSGNGEQMSLLNARKDAHEAGADTLPTAEGGW